MVQKQTALAVQGDRISGEEVRQQNITAALSLANTVKSSLGPQGLDKMMVDDIGDVTITNDGATILKLLEVEHPAAKVLVELSQLQDQEVGDGTTSVVLLAAELLKHAGELVKHKIHPTSVISGYRLASREATKYITGQLTVQAETLGRDCLVNVAMTSLSSKVLGPDMLFFADMAVTAMSSVKRTNAKGQTKAPVAAVHILKAHGQRAKDSMLVHGYALNCTLGSQAMPKAIQGAKIACLDINLMKAKLAMGVQVLVTDPKELEKIREREGEISKQRLQKIVNSGANVVLTTKGIDDFCLKFLVEAGAIGVRRCLKEDLKRIARATGATLVSTLANLEGEESFEASMLGQAEQVVVERVGDNELILIKGTAAASSASIVLRGANEMLCDEMERSLHDALCAVRKVMESGHVVPGGGAVEAALSISLENLAHSLESRSQLAISCFAQALLGVPKTLVVNAAKDSVDLVSKLRAAHHLSQTDPTKLDYKWYGLDLSKGTIRNNVQAGVLEPASSKVKCIKFATEAAITVLRIDDAIKIMPEPETERDHHGH